NSGPRRRTRPARSEQNEWTRGYRQTKATKCGGTGGREAERLDSTVEAGELAPGGPLEGSEAAVGRRDRGKQAAPIQVHPPVHGTRTDSHGDPSGAANLSAEEPYALMRARTGLREPWRATARATRPDARRKPPGSRNAKQLARILLIIPCFEH